MLGNLVEVGKLSDAEYQKWVKTPLKVKQRRDYFHDVAPYFTEQVRRDLVKSFGDNGLYTGGYRVETTVIPDLDVLAAENVDMAVRKLDKRQGWRGPEAHLEGGQAELFRERGIAQYGDGKLVEDRLYLGLVEQVSEERARVRVGANLYNLPLANMSWAARYSKSDATNDKQIT